MLQGSMQSVICAFVFDELPKIYKMVLNDKPKAVEESVQGNPSGRPVVKCDKCRFKSNMIQMKLHIKNVHVVKPKKATKRLPVFTPMAKESKRCKSNPGPKLNTEIKELLKYVLHFKK